MITEKKIIRKQEFSNEVVEKTLTAKLKFYNETSPSNREDVRSRTRCGQLMGDFVTSHLKEQGFERVNEYSDYFTSFTSSTYTKMLGDFDKIHLKVTRIFPYTINIKMESRGDNIDLESEEVLDLGALNNLVLTGEFRYSKKNNQNVLETA